MALENFINFYMTSFVHLAVNQFRMELCKRIVDSPFEFENEKKRVCRMLHKNFVYSRLLDLLLYMKRTSRNVEK